MESDCVFCDRTKFAERLVGETPEFFVIATLGQITDGGYVLAVPKRHVSCIGAMPPHEIAVFGILHAGIQAALRKEYGVNPIVFEHGLVGQTVPHAHFHFVPAVVDLTPKIRADFPETQVAEIQNAAYLGAFYRTHPEPYLFWTTPGGRSMMCWNPPAPPQYLRLVVAELLGHPERGNWRTMDPELDKRLWQETVVRLKPYFA